MSQAARYDDEFLGEKPQRQTYSYLLHSFQWSASSRFAVRWAAKSKWRIQIGLSYTKVDRTVANEARRRKHRDTKISQKEAFLRGKNPECDTNLSKEKRMKSKPMASTLNMQGIDLRNPMAEYHKEAFWGRL